MTDLKQTITIQRERLTEARRLDNVSRSLQQAMAELQGVEELRPIPADLADITPTWLQQRIDECTAPIKADKSLTSDERRERLKPWRAISQRATRLVNIVLGILTSNPDVVFTIEDDENGQHRYFISEAQIEAAALQRATYDVPPQALEHLQLIQAIREKVDALREFERAHNVRRYTVEQLMNLPWTGGLDELWVSGSIFKDAMEERWKNYFPTYRQPKSYEQHKQQIQNQ